MCRQSPWQRENQHPTAIYTIARTAAQIWHDPILSGLTQTVSYYLPLSGLPAFSNTAANRSTGRGNTITVVFSVEMLDNVCR
jgi:hypothetical protein